MHKEDLIEKISENTGFTKTDANRIVTEVIKVIIDEVANGEKVTLTGFGSFEARKRAARNGVNPKTKEPISIPETTVPHFKAGKVFKDAVKK